MHIHPFDGILVADEHFVDGRVKLTTAPGVEAAAAGGRTGLPGLDGAVGVFGAGDVEWLTVGFLAAADGVGRIGFVAVLDLL